MDRRFTVRIASQSGETLSGFLMRATEANQLAMKYLLNSLSVFEGKNIFSRPYMLDIYPLNHETYEFLEWMTGINIDGLKDMTFIPVYDKFLDYVDNTSSKKCKIDKSIYIKDRRRYCPICIHENGIYKMAWQLADIDMCDVHFTKLTSRCHRCGVEQPYIKKDLSIYNCYNCNAVLYEQPVEYVYDKEFINNQIQKYKRWSYLLNKNTILANTISGFSKEKSLAITCLYSLQQGENDFNNHAWVKYFDKTILYCLLSLILDRPNTKHIIINRLFDLLDVIHIDLDDFSKITVPSQFIESIFDYCRKDKIEPGACYTSWCSHFGSNIDMEELEHNEFNGTDYTIKYLCKGCHIIYGFNKKNNKWETVDNLTQVISTIIPLIKADFSKNAISVKTGFDRKKVSRAIAYIASHGIVSSELIQKYTPNNIPSDIFEKFALLLSLRGSKQRLAKELFKWNENDYFYLLMLDNVQEFILDNSYKYRVRKYKVQDELVNKIKDETENAISNGDILSITSIIKKLNISEKVMKRYNCIRIISDGKVKKREFKVNEIKNKVREFLDKNKSSWNKVILTDIYKYIGISKNGVCCLDNSLVEWIVHELSQYKLGYKEYKESLYIELINNAFESISVTGEVISFKNVATVSGIPIHILYTHNTLREKVENKMAILKCSKG